MNNPSQWMWGLRGTVEHLTRPRDLFSPLFDSSAPPAQFREAFCIDPRFLAVNGITPDPPDGNPNFFPYVDTTASLLRMPRISLNAVPGGATAMGLEQADTVFLSLDDLEFRRPSADRTLPPVQLNDVGGETDADGDGDLDGDWNPDAGNTSFQPGERIRKAFGRLSWMATVVPREEFGVQGGDTYTLSIVVFHQRDPSFTMGAPASETENERAVRIPVVTTSPSYNGFKSGGVGGGDVALMPRVSGLLEPDADRELAVKAGDWVMLSRRNRFQTGVDSSGNPIFAEAPRWHRWYRVLAADPLLYDSDTETSAPSLSGSWIRYVTLDGPDWPPITPNHVPAPAGEFHTQVTIVKDVVAVFEKTIRLETSSLWTN
jgi:hypothetical protein